MPGHRNAPAARADPLAGGPWLSEQAMAALPQMRRDFDFSRDPAIRRQLLDLAKTEAERRKATGRPSGMVGRDKPVPVLRPVKPLSGAVDRAVFEGRWLAEQRDAAMAGATAGPDRVKDAPVRSRSPQPPIP